MSLPLRQAALYGTLFVATHFVNKYVLSVLNFQFPTIFQGWQTLVGFLMLSLLVTTRHLPPLLVGVTRKDIIFWLPGMMFFVGAIYSGSKSLSKLSIPVYLSLHNLVTVIVCTGQLAIYRELTSLYSYVMLMLLVISSIIISIFDPDFQPDGYFWMCVHIITTGGYVMIGKFSRVRLKLNSHEKLYSNYLYSMIVLAPSSYLLGDAVQAGSYPYLYFSKFYMGCIMSGIFGVFLSLSYMKLIEMNLDKADISRITGISKLTASVLSLLFFDMTLNASHVFWLAVNHLAAIVCEDSSTMEESPDTPPQTNPQKLTQQNANTHDFIKISMH